MMDDKTILFEKTPVPKAVMQLAVPTILSSLVMVIYNLADTYFVGMMNNPVQNAAVTLAAPVLLAFNAVNNLFGVGSSSMMSRALGRRDYESVRRSSAFGFYCALFFGLLFSVLCTVGLNPLLILLGADANTMDATAGYLKWTVLFGAAPAILNVVMAYMVRAEGSSLHASIGTMSGCLLNIILDPIFILPWGFDMGAAGAGLATFLSNCVACVYFFAAPGQKENNLCLYQSREVFASEVHCAGSVRRGHTGGNPESSKCDRYDHTEQFYILLRRPGSGCHGHYPENQHGSPAGSHGLFPGNHAPYQLQLCQRQPQENEGNHILYHQDPAAVSGGGIPGVFCRGGLAYKGVYGQ